MRNEFEYSYRVLQFNLSAGLSDFEVPIHAERVDYVSPTDGPELQIRLQTKSNDQLPLRPNGSIEATFTRIYISAAAAARNVFLMIGAPAAVKVTGRDVSISGTIRSLSFKEYVAQLGQLFIGTSTNTPTAGQFAHCEIRNPIGSGKTVQVLGWKLHNASAGAVIFHNTRRITPLGTPVFALKNAIYGGPAGIAEVRFQSNAASLAFETDTVPRRKITVPANSSTNFFDCSDVIPEGSGWLWTSTTVTVNMDLEVVVAEY